MRMPLPIRPAAAAAVAATLVVAGTVAGSPTAHAAADFDFTRVAGENRYATAAAAAGEFGAASTVILASGEQGRYPDALAAAYLAGVKDAPVLLTRHHETPAVVRAAIRDSGARTVILVGGEAAISAAQEDALRAEYGNVTRVAGPNRYGTAAQVIATAGEATDGTALLATGTNFPDALGAGPVAFSERMPLAITKPGDLPEAILAALDRAGVTRVLVLGGLEAVGQPVVEELKAAGIEVAARLNGSDRAETSVLLARYAMDTFGFAENAVNVASGYAAGGGADALGGAALTGREQRALLITRTDDVAGSGVLALLAELADAGAQGRIFGSRTAVSESLELAMEKAVLGSGAQIGDELFDTPQDAVNAAKAGDTVVVFGADNPGFTVTIPGVTVSGEGGASVSGAVQLVGVAGVTVRGLTITPSDVANQLAGVYVDDVTGVELVDNQVVGTGPTGGAGVINAIGGAVEEVTIRDNTFRNLTQGVFANPSAEFTITDNTFRENVAASANDAVSQIRGNRFINNTEAVGLGVAGSTVVGNSFGEVAADGWHVADYTTDAGYDLEAVKAGNGFDTVVVVSTDGRRIVDASSVPADPVPSESPTPAP